MRKILTALCALLLATPALANGPADSEWNPPPRYDHLYVGDLRVYSFSDQRELVQGCHAFETDGNHFVTNNERGCSYHTDDYKMCVIFLLDRPFQGQTPENVFRHEIGHCNGWPGTHPDDIPNGRK